MRITAEERERRWRAKENERYSRWLDRRRRGPRVPVIVGNVVAILVGTVAAISLLLGTGWVGGSIALVAFAVAVVLLVKATSDETWISSITLACVSGACYLFVGVACVAGSAAHACS